MGRFKEKKENDVIILSQKRNIKNKSIIKKH